MMMNEKMKSSQKNKVKIFVLAKQINEEVENTIESIKEQTITNWNCVVLYENENCKINTDNKDSKFEYMNIQNSNDIFNKINEENEEYTLIINEKYMLDKTFLECAIWTYKTNEKADLIYSNVCNYENMDVENEEYPQCFIISTEKLKKITKNINNSLFAEVFNKNNIFKVKMNYFGIVNFNNSKCENNIKERDEFKYPTNMKLNYDSYPYTTSINLDKKVENKKINLLLILPWLKVGGADKFNLDLISNLDKKIYNITIITTEVCNYIWRRKFEKYATVYDLTSFLDRKDWATFMYYLIKGLEINLVFQSNSFYGYYVIPWLKCNFPKVSFVDFLHAETWEWRNGGYPRESNAIDNFVDKTYTCSNHLKSVMIDEMKRKKQNIETVYIGVDTDKFDEETININDYPEITKYKSQYEDKKIILFCARLSDEKRPILAIKVFNELYKENKNLMLFIVGPGEEKEPRDIVNKLGLNNNVIFFGRQDDVRPFYKLAEVELICSIEEGITLTTYEALSMKTPVVTANVGGQSELVTNECGRLVENVQTVKNINEDYTQEEILRYKKAIFEILYNDKYKEMKEKCRNIIVEKFSLKKMVEKMNTEFVTLVNCKEKSKEIYSEDLYKQYLVLYNQLSQKSFLREGINIISTNIQDLYEESDKNRKMAEVYKSKYVELEQKNENIIKENEKLMNELEKIYNSRRWKYSSKIAEIFKDKTKKGVVNGRREQRK